VLAKFHFEIVGRDHSEQLQDSIWRYRLERLQDRVHDLNITILLEADVKKCERLF